MNRRAFLMVGVSMFVIGFLIGEITGFDVLEWMFG